MHEKSRENVKALVFDLDGTLVDSKQDLALAVNLTLAALGREALPTELVASYVGSGAPLLIARALGGRPAPEELEGALEFFLNCYDEHLLDHTRPYPGVREALERLRGTPMAVLSNKPRDPTVRILEGLALAEFFKPIYGGNSFAAKKPDPSGALSVLSEFGVTAAEAVMVGDSEVDVQTARNAGMISAIVNFGFGVHDRGRYPADVYLDRMEELLPLFFADGAGRR